MRPRKTRSGWITAALIVAACCVPQQGHAAEATPKARAPLASMLPPIGPYPDAPCTLASRMNIYIDDYGELWECMCEALTEGHVCDWVNHGAEGVADFRRIARKLHLARLPRMRPIPVPLNLRLAL